MYPAAVMQVKMQSLVTPPDCGKVPKKAISNRAPRRGNPAAGVTPAKPPMIARPNGALRPLACLGAALLCAGPGRAQDDGVITAVSSQVSEEYARVRLPDGSFQPETYTFGEGGRISGASRDEQIDKLSFLDVAKVIAAPLAEKKYVTVPDRDPDNTKLLIMVYWGTTSGTSDGSDSLAYQNLQRSQGFQAPPPPPPAGGRGPGPGGDNTAALMQHARQDGADGAMAEVLAENWQRDQADMRNAMLLGYDSALAETSSIDSIPLKMRRADLISEIEESRYFIVLMAYDYQALWKQRKHRLFWVTRISVRERGANFAKVFPAMAAYASQYFGQSTRGLLRKPLPEGQVEIGEPRSLGVIPEK